MSAAAELSSLHTALDEITARVTSLTGQLSGAESERIGNDLFEVERSLLAATRRLSKVVGALG